ncbi:tol-pal system protein [Mesorhizobium sp. Root157]|uniref:tol-pal system protein YbgF n=1 Tax=Mesorhizobium sp. Root157 TaxID=1736477 RepID=UPI0006FE1E0A|nr:tol-pal system protein YbgF [Mesorhizobium sp. Root157]KRA00284.1 tol-pal system protein [Mesorhizobium sp. Root157]
MHPRTILSGTLAALLFTGAAALASGAESSAPAKTGFHLPGIGLPGVFGNNGAGNEAAQQVQLAQSAGTAGLEEQIRALNGRVEELNFQILQMQEQIRKTQEDNEFRMQQLEQGSGGAAQGTQKKSDASGAADMSVAETPADPSTSGDTAGGASVEDVIIDSGTGDPGQVIPGTGAPAKTFGTITVDKNGNVIDAGSNTQSTTPTGQGAAVEGQSGTSGGSIVAALPQTDNADELYRNSYQFVLSGDYDTAEQGFRDYVTRFPKDGKAADAHYWLGESLLGQQKYRDAAEVFLAASKDYPKAKKAPDMMLKLGVSLVGLKQRDVACATFGEIGKRYPNISGALKERVKQERALASC